MNLVSKSILFILLSLILGLSSCKKCGQEETYFISDELKLWGTPIGATDTLIFTDSQGGDPVKTYLFFHQIDTITVGELDCSIYLREVESKSFAFTTTGSPFLHTRIEQDAIFLGGEPFSLNTMTWALLDSAPTSIYDPVHLKNETINGKTYENVLTIRREGPEPVGTKNICWIYYTPERGIEAFAFSESRTSATHFRQ